MEPPVIGIDAQSLTGKYQTGLGVYSRSIVRLLERHPETLKVKLLWPRGHKVFRRTWERLAWEQYYLVMTAIWEEVDLIHVPCFSLPRFTRIPKVVTAHDLIVLKNPELMAPGSRWYFAKWIPSTYKTADHIIAVSKTVKNDLVDILGINPDDITVIYHGIDPAFVRTTEPDLITQIRHRYHVPMEYFMMVGSFESRKNINHAIEAFSRIANISRHMKLLLVGRENDYFKKMKALVKGLELEEQILFPGYIPDRELATLYSMATAFLFPSSAEGFGLPLLEAIATGCPVIASDIPVFHEIAGDSVVYIPPGDSSALVDEMQRMLTDPRRRAEYVRKGLSRSLNFDWDRSATETLKVYLRVLKKRKRI